MLLDDGTRSFLGTVEGERRPLPAQETRYRPLIVTTIGRSGSTWSTWLLGQHPDIADYRSFEYESTVGAYFAEALRLLTQPTSYYQPIRGEIDYAGWWHGEDRSWPLAWHTSDDSIDQWLGGRHVDDLIEFFGGRIEALFGRIAVSLGKEDASYVVEKMPPSYFGQPMLAELFPGTRELVLVRDFRDVAASLFAFGEKRGRRWYEGSRSRARQRSSASPFGTMWKRSSGPGTTDAGRHSSFATRTWSSVLRRRLRTCSHISIWTDGRKRSRRCSVQRVRSMDRAGRACHQRHRRRRVDRALAQYMAPELQRLCEESLHGGLEAFGYLS